MKDAPSCPRCGSALRAPGLWSSSWMCASHGSVAPLRVAPRASAELLGEVVRRAAVPVWLPWPLPRGWLLTGTATVGDDRTGHRAVVLGLSGPAPLGDGLGEMVVVAEEPGVGVGARLGGLAGIDGGGIPDSTPPHAKVHAAGHPTSLWCLEAPADRAVFVGEALGHWLWAVLWPATAGVLLVEELVLSDLRDGSADVVREVPVGAPSPRLSAARGPA
ncbi:MAG: DUF6758 family protein [Actinomycetes bacterium]